MVTGHLDDFDTFRKEVLNVLADRRGVAEQKP